MQLNSIKSVSIILATIVTTGASCAEQPLKEKIEVVEVPTSITNEEKKLAPTLPSESAKSSAGMESNAEYLKENPAEMEAVLTDLIRTGNAEKLALLIPVYLTMPNHDASIIEWGNAIIFESKGDFKNAIKLYRKINSALPKIKLLRFHLARALFQDKQYAAAKSEFEKLRTENISAQDTKVTDDYLNAINKENTWNYSATVSFLNDPNINNAPKEGTKVVINGISITPNTPKTGRGLSYSLSADKKWNHSNNMFTAIHAGINGNYYWNYHKGDELTTDIGFGIGYSDARTEIELVPFYRNNLYSDNDKSSLKQYYKNFGLRTNVSHWINPKLKYQTLIKLSKDKYIDAYKHYNGGNHQWSNTLVFSPSPTQYWFSGLDYNQKNARDKDDSYKRFGIRMGWGQVWGSGLSTQLTLGAAKRNYQGKDFFGIQRSNKEYFIGTSVWHRNFYYKGITPRLTWQYQTTKSNNSLYNYDKNNFFIELSKEF